VNQAVPSFLTHLECPICGKRFDAASLQSFCRTCYSPLLAQYDLVRLQGQLSPHEVANRPRGLWRWAELLPVQDPGYRYTLGEGDTPFLHLQRLGKEIGLAGLYIKDEGPNPTGTCQARGLAVAVSRAAELGAQSLSIGTFGNSGSAMAAYARIAGLHAHVFLPQEALPVHHRELRMYKPELHLVNGSQNDLVRLTTMRSNENGWFDVSIFKEPYHLEGKKTMGLELAQSMGWSLPDIIVYPMGEGSGLVGIWKGLKELQTLGWVNGKLPRIVGVQKNGLKPSPQFNPLEEQQPGNVKGNSVTSAAHGFSGGLNTRLVDWTLKDSAGILVTVHQVEVEAARRQLAFSEGILVSPEGAAGFSAIQALREENWIRPNESVALFNPGSGLKYMLS